MCPNLKCISIMMSFLKYITGFFYELWTFDRLRGHKTFFFASLFWKAVQISHIWKLYRIFHSILIKKKLLLNGLCLRWYVDGFPLSFTVLLAHLVKANVSFCHHLTSVVWNLLSQMNWNLVGSIYGKSSRKSAHFVPIG